MVMMDDGDSVVAGRMKQAERKQVNEPDGNEQSRRANKQTNRQANKRTNEQNSQNK
jgi:hypothetical protein